MAETTGSVHDSPSPWGAPPPNPILPTGGEKQCTTREVREFRVANSSRLPRGVGIVVEAVPIIEQRSQLVCILDRQDFIRATMALPAKIDEAPEH